MVRLVSGHGANSWCCLQRHLGHPKRKPTLWNLRKVSTWISLSMPRRLTRTGNFHLLWIFCFRNHYSIPPLYPWDRMCRPGLACADCAGWSGSIHYAESMMLVFSWNGSFNFILLWGTVLNALDSSRIIMFIKVSTSKWLDKYCVVVSSCEQPDRMQWF